MTQVIKVASAVIRFIICLALLAVHVFGAAELKGNFRWEAGVIHYSFQPAAFTSDEQQQVRLIMRHWERAAGVMFVETPLGAFDHHLLVSHGLCDLGTNTCNIETDIPNPHQVQTFVDPTWVGKSLHELGHVLGLAHEHQRTDRAGFVDVDARSAAVRSACLHSEQYLPLIGNALTAYDFDSIMHYGSNCGATTVMLPQPIYRPNVDLAPACTLGRPCMGQRFYISRYDTVGVNSIYPGHVAQFTADISQGNGTITLDNHVVFPYSSIPDLIDPWTDQCQSGAACQQRKFPQNAVITLAATPSSGYAFDGWTGDVDPSQQPLEVIALTMDIPRTITAHFRPDDSHKPPGSDPNCWAWDRDAGQYGGWAWNPSCGEPPPHDPAHEPPGCWNTKPNPQGTWLAIPCGGRCVTQGGTPSMLNFARCNPTGTSIEGIVSGDPNDKAGSEGVGPQRYIAGATPLRYDIAFGNESNASGSALTVVVRDRLPITLDDLRTFSFGPIAIGTHIVVPPPGPAYSGTIDLRPVINVVVGITAKLDVATGDVSWAFTSLDPLTDQPVTDKTLGFLPPGEDGSVFFTVMPKQTLSTNAQIQNQAIITFDVNEPKRTLPWLNTLDFTPPTSQVAPLPTAEHSTSFTVHWGGSDIGSGIQSYTIYVSVDGGPFLPWLTNTSSTQGIYTGLAGHTYGFYTIAADAVGNVEGAKTTAEATTTVQGSSSCATDISPQLTISRGGFRFDHTTNSFVQTLAVTNKGATLSGAALVLDGLRSGITLSNSDGSTECAGIIGSPWIGIPGTLSTGQSVSVNLIFSDPAKASISYSTRVLAGNGQK